MKSFHSLVGDPSIPTTVNWVSISGLEYEFVYGFKCFEADNLKVLSLSGGGKHERVILQSAHEYHLFDVIGVNFVLKREVALLRREAGHGVRFEDSSLNVGRADDLAPLALGQLRRPRLIYPHVVYHLAHLAFVLQKTQEVVPVDVRG